MAHPGGDFLVGLYDKQPGLGNIGSEEPSVQRVITDYRDFVPVTALAGQHRTHGKRHIRRCRNHLNQMIQCTGFVQGLNSDHRYKPNKKYQCWDCCIGSPGGCVKCERWRRQCIEDIARVRSIEPVPVPIDAPMIIVGVPPPIDEDMLDALNDRMEQHALDDSPDMQLSDDDVPPVFVDAAVTVEPFSQLSPVAHKYIHALLSEIDRGSGHFIAPPPLPPGMVEQTGIVTGDDVRTGQSVTAHTTDWLLLVRDWHQTDQQTARLHWTKFLAVQCVNVQFIE